MDRSGWYHIYTDGCCLNNGQGSARAGIGVYFPDHERLNVSEPLHGRPASNRAAITAIVRAAEIASDNGIMRVAIHTDSHFAIDSALNWFANWDLNDFLRPVHNEVIAMRDALRCLHEYKLELDEGHNCSGTRNEKAKYLAKKGAERTPFYF